MYSYFKFCSFSAAAGQSDTPRREYDISLLLPLLHTLILHSADCLVYSQVKNGWYKRVHYTLKKPKFYILISTIK